VKGDVRNTSTPIKGTQSMQTSEDNKDSLKVKDGLFKTPILSHEDN
jgi:hypothetical protein